ncbi:MAG: SPOR domain-containing protein [Flavobacteriaceae bacterium]|nr:SPOR domain-containing protein [Flavobacteriaceae bacterium]
MLFQNKKTHLISIVFIVLFTFSNYAQQTEGVVKIQTSANIDKVIAQKKQYNKNIKTLNGFKIQIFYGNEKNSYKVKDEFRAVFDEIPAKIVFSSPQWKVQVGNFKTRLEADKKLLDIKKEYPSAIVVLAEINKDK